MGHSPCKYVEDVRLILKKINSGLGPTDGGLLDLCFGKFNNFKLIEALKQCISKSSYKYLLLWTNNTLFCYSSSRNQIGKSTHFWKINIFVKTAVFVICIPKSLNMRSEWGNIKECNQFPRAILNICWHVAKNGICSCFVPVLNTIVHNFLLCTKLHHLDMILFRSNMNLSYSFMVLLRCHIWHVTDSLWFVYLCLHIT